ncbi:chemotaxis protein CheX [Bdellovibrio sp. KM01]|uniref:chemotaxis protein CheX n=1 Tax=Bdellovibrio sp. KM01 TaxID=2748865 RepID=UPI0015EA03BB|nr:chemotaxis protein CheX [Bdellovibrio sp. KM01]QLY25568.1 response regulator [Bdellovibrio sp. KM01]
MKTRKTILIVDNNSGLENLVREPLSDRFRDSTVAPILVRAKDGAEAAIKTENQKFDVVLIDTEVPRLMDGGFVYGLHSYKNTQDANLIVVTQKDSSELPDTLQSCVLLKKPINPDDLVNAMVKCLNQGAPSATPAASASAAPQAKYAVDVRVINAVIKATMNVFAQFGVQNITMGKPETKSPHEALKGEISSVVEIKSQSYQGFLAISFDKASYLEVVSTMLMEEQTELNSENQDAVGEINNIIFGNAKSEITNFGVQLTVPKVLIGADSMIECKQGSAGMLIPFSTTKGHFYLKVIAVPIGK